MRDIDSVIKEIGFETILRELGEFKNHNKDFVEIAEKYDIDIQTWFEIGWLLNEHLGSVRGDVLPLISFNYYKVEKEAARIVRENKNGVKWSELVSEVASEVENATVTDVSTYLEMKEITSEMNDGEEFVTDIEVKYD